MILNFYFPDLLTGPPNYIPMTYSTFYWTTFLSNFPSLLILFFFLSPLLSPFLIFFEVPIYHGYIHPRKVPLLIASTPLPVHQRSVSINLPFVPFSRMTVDDTKDNSILLAKDEHFPPFLIVCRMIC